MGSSPTPGTTAEPLEVGKTVQFAVWLFNVKGNRESTIERKIRYFKRLRGSPDDMAAQILNGKWKDKVKSNALDTVEQYAEFIGAPFKRPNFRAYDNLEMYVPAPEMVKQFLYRVRSVRVRARIKIAVETGASAGEVWRLTWADLNAQSKTLTVVGNKGHRTMAYGVLDELVALLIQLPRATGRIFAEVKNVDGLNDGVNDYKKRLARETGNLDFLKIHFHTFRHFAISWHYFKTKDIVDSQRFARHCNINNTLKYVHIVKSWIKANEYAVVYAEDKAELSKYLSEGYSLSDKDQLGILPNQA